MKSTSMARVRGEQLSTGNAHERCISVSKQYLKNNHGKNYSNEDDPGELNIENQSDKCTCGK